MDKELARRAHAILMQVLDVAPAERVLMIEAACGDDERLRARVIALSEALDRSGDFLETPAVARPPDVSAPRDSVIDSIGDYRIVGVIGVGGMATVYEATQVHPNRRVALKVMRQGLAQTSAIHRFQFETEILARLQHPGIAQIFEAGTWAERDGVATPYFTMEYISDARTITEYAVERDLPQSDRLRMFAEVCDAVQHGHQNGVIHRDLKPGNILVDSQGRPKVIDFGVARSIDPGQAWITQHADLHHLVGTLNYMSPEQCAGAATIDIRTDVFSLGVVLYELVCGQLPHNLSGVPVPDALRIVRERDPPRPSAIDPHLRGDIDAIVTMALDKDPDRRYRSAAALGADIRRHLNHQTVEARPPTLLYQCRQFARRNRTLVTASVLVAATVVVGAVVSARFGYRASAEAERRRVAEVKAVEQRDAALWNAYVANMAAAFSAYQAGELQQVRTRLNRAPDALRGWEWRFLLGVSERSLYTIPAHNDMVFGFDATSEGSRLATSGRDGHIRIWDPASRTCKTNIDATDGGPIYAISFSSDGRRLASGSEDGMVRIWDPQTGQALQLLQTNKGRVTSVWYGRDDRVASVSQNGAGYLWEVSSGTQVATLSAPDHRVDGVIGSHDGATMMTWNLGGDAWLHSADGATITHRFRSDGGIHCGAFGPDDNYLAVGGVRGTVTVWNIRTGETVYCIKPPESVSTIRALAFSPTGDRLAVGQIDRDIHVASMETGDWLESLLGHEEAVSGLRFSMDGRLLYSTSWDKSMRIWGFDSATRTDYITELARHEGHVLSVAFSPDSRLLATGARDNTVRLWEPELGRALGVLRGHTGDVSCVAFAPDGETIASGSYDRTVMLWSAATGRHEGTLTGHDGQVWTIAFSPDGRRLASGGDDKSIRLWDVDRRQLVRRFEGHDHRVISVAFSPDGRQLASTSRDQSVRLWDVDTGRLLWAFAGHSSDVFAVVFSHDGRYVYSGSRDQTVRVLDAASGTCLDTLSGHGQFVSCLSLSPDGTRLAAGSWFGEVILWDLAKHDVVASFKAHADVIRSVAFSPDGRWLGATSYNGTIRLFDAVPARQRLEAHRAADRHRELAEALLLELTDEAHEPLELLKKLEVRPDLDVRTRSWARLLIFERALASGSPPAGRSAD